MTNCVYCKQYLYDKREESGAIRAHYATKDGDFGCDFSPECNEEGVGSHLPDSESLQRVLEQGEERFPEITALYNWSTNYEAGKTPFTLFIDLIGYTSMEFGRTIYDLNNVSKGIGYLELDYLGDALKEYANKGADAYDFVVRILDAEGRE